MVADYRVDGVVEGGNGTDKGIEKQRRGLKHIGWGLVAVLAVLVLAFIVFKADILPSASREKELVSYRVDWREAVPDISMDLAEIRGKECTVSNLCIALVFPYADRYQMRNFNRIKISIRGIGNLGGQTVALIYSAVIKIKIIPAEFLAVRTLSVEQTELEIFDGKGSKINVDIGDVRDVLTTRLQNMQIVFKVHPGVSATSLVDDNVWVRTDAIEFFQWK